MPRRATLALVFAFFASAPSTAACDAEGTATIYVQSSTTDGSTARGDRYAKCFPGDGRDSKPRTLIYKVGPDADELEDAYDWYSEAVYLAGTSKGTLVARVTTRFSGREANKGDQGVAFYFRGRLLKEYSTLDLVTTGPSVNEVGASHYRWCGRVIGYRWLASAKSRVLKFGFVLETVNGRRLCFDARTGKLMGWGWGPETLGSNARQ
jgi:hypothetical protein